MNKQIIKLSDTAAARIKEIMSNADDKTIGVRVGVKSGGCAGMSYSMEYAKDKKANEILRPSFIFWEQKWIIKKRNFLHNLYLKIQMSLKDAVVVSHLRSNS